MRTKTLIALLLCVVVFVMASSVAPLSQKRKSKKELRDSIETAELNMEADSILRDSLGREIVDTTKMDSMQLAIYHHNRAIDDSIRLDSINRQRANGINSPVQYSAEDSLVYDATSKTARLYGASTVKYENMDLASEKIHMSIDSSVVHATGARDTTDTTGLKLIGTPVFTMGADKYESDTMAFNFKTKKGLYLRYTLSRRTVSSRVRYQSVTPTATFICSTDVTPLATPSIPTSTLPFLAPRCAPARTWCSVPHTL